MSPSALLADLYLQGARFRVTGDQLGVRAKRGPLSAETRIAIVEHKPELLRLLGLAGQYQAVLRALFSELPDGPSSEICARFIDEQARFTDELGPALTQAIVNVTARDWRDKTDICPWCHEVGECEESSHSSEEGGTHRG